MITFDNGLTRFTYRIVGIALYNNHVLLHKAAHEKFWSLPGGRAELLEPATETLKREMREELGVEIAVERLLWVLENFFEYEGKTHHEVGLYFLMTLPLDSYVYQQSEPFMGKEEHIRLIFKWFRLDELENIPLYPTFLQKALNKIPEGTEHVVHRDSNE